MMPFFLVMDLPIIRMSAVLQIATQSWTGSKKNVTVICCSKVL